MSKKAPYLIEVGLGLLLAGYVAWSFQTKSSAIEKFSLNTYDFFTEFREVPTDVEAIKLVEIDNESVSTLGRWPWPRALVADLVDKVVVSGSRVIGLNILYNEPDQSPGLEEVAILAEDYQALLKKHLPRLKKRKYNTNDFRDFADLLAESQYNLDGDTILARTLEEAADIILPMYFIPGDTLGDNLPELPEFFSNEKLALSNANEDFVYIPSGMAADVPMEEFGARVLATGHSNLFQDVDGVVRRISPLIRYGNAYFPSFALQLVREYLNLQRDSVTWDKPMSLTMYKANIPFDEGGQTFIDFAGPAGTFEGFSALDVLSENLPENALNNKIVMVGVTAPGLAPTYTVPGGEQFTGLEIWANHVANILNQTFITRPLWAVKAEWGMIGLAALIVMFVLPFVRARFSIPLAALVFAGMLGVSWYLFVSQGMWVSPAYGAALLVSGFVVLVGKRLVFTERGKELVEAEGAETNKMLGLSFQGQGMLDLAFEKFRKCEVDKSMKELLYNLGLDMERKRMFAKAAAVYEHIAATDPKYKDIQSKIEMLKKAGQGAVFGGIGQKGGDATVVLEGMDQNTTLGRYEVMKELGRGAMGIVYLGKDPKINRQVAIKTLRFDDDVNEEQQKSVKERFFREAESAGNLTHPNIIRIFDAGEDQEVAYIAMELLDGEDLKRFCEKAELFPIEKTLDIVIHVADALDYAHKMGVVHRDIKPANLMMLKNGTLRITDFGIARIQASSKTATGAVLGTPAYMSPEQVNGKKVDGRADIFSLGVTLYELLTGEKPFQADSIAALLYRIANVDHEDPRHSNKDIPADVVDVINKALQKDANNRYQNGGEMATDLKKALENFKNGTSPKSEPPAPAPEPPPPPPPPAPPEPAPIERPKAEEKSGDADLVSELEDVFKKQTDTQTEKPAESTAVDLEKEADKTVVLPPKEDSDKTVVLDKKDVPRNPNIEQGYQAPDNNDKGSTS